MPGGHRILGAALALALGAAACTTSGGGPSEEEQAYLDGVRAAQTIRDDTLRSVVEALSITYPVRERLFGVAREIGFGEAEREALAAAERLRPPERFVADHESWVASIREAIHHFDEGAEALERGALLDVVIAFMRIEADLAARIPGWSAEFCRAAIPMVEPGGFEGGPEVVCRRGEAIPGGPYAEDLYGILLEAQLEIGRRIGLSGLPAFDPAEEIAYLGVIQPEVEALFDRALESVRGLSPPDDLRADHDLVVRFLEDMRAAAGRITEAAEAGDRELLEARYRESLEPGRALRQGLSERGRAIVEGLHLFTDA